MPCEKRKTRQVFAFVDPYSAKNTLFCPKRPLPAPQKGSEEGAYLYFFVKTKVVCRCDGTAFQMHCSRVPCGAQQQTEGRPDYFST